MKLMKKKLNVISILLFGLIFSLTQALYTQAVSPDLNDYYRFPFSFGLEFQPLYTFNDYGAIYYAYDISGTIRMPLSSSPILQPSIQAGVIQFSTIEGMTDTKDFSHFDFYGLIGLHLSYRFTRIFEIGGELSTGLSQSYYKHLLEEEEGAPDVYYGDLNWVAQAGLHLTINPVYNLSIDFHPHIKYLATTGRLDKFDGFIFGLGLSISCRIGKDPDRYRYLFIEEVEFPHLFAGLQPYYSENSIATLTIKNNTDAVLENIKIAFFQNGYMDSPTPSRGIYKLDKDEEATVALYASFNDNAFSVEGMTPLVGEIIINYEVDGRRIEQKKPVTYNLFDKTALVWDDDRKVASYITPADSILKNYARFIQQACHETINQGYNWPLQFAIQVYYGLQEIDFIYQTDSIQPFAEVKQSRYLIDSIFLPRQSLQRLSGDCDDLTVLFCSLLESIGIETGYITLPDHIFPIFNTNVPMESYMEIFPDLNMFIEIDGEAWIPVEATLLEKENFREAWRKGIANYSSGRAHKNIEINLTKNCQKVFKPITLKEKNIPINYGDAENINTNFKTDLMAAINKVLGFYKKDLEKKEDYNKFALHCMRLGEYTMAESFFEQSFRLDETYYLPVINLGNLFYIQKKYERSLIYYKRAEKHFELNNNRSPHYVYLLLNISVVYSYMEDMERAKEFFKKADAINPQITGRTVYKDYKASLQKGLTTKSSGKGNMMDEIWIVE